jgi:hypothetical protein
VWFVCGFEVAGLRWRERPHIGDERTIHLLAKRKSKTHTNTHPYTLNATTNKHRAIYQFIAGEEKIETILPMLGNFAQMALSFSHRVNG